MLQLGGHEYQDTQAMNLFLMPYSLVTLNLKIVFKISDVYIFVDS